MDEDISKLLSKMNMIGVDVLGYNDYAIAIKDEASKLKEESNGLNNYRLIRKLSGQLYKDKKKLYSEVVFNGQFILAYTSKLEPVPVYIGGPKTIGKSIKGFIFIPGEKAPILKGIKILKSKNVINEPNLLIVTSMYKQFLVTISGQVYELNRLPAIGDLGIRIDWEETRISEDRQCLDLYGFDILHDSINNKNKSKKPELVYKISAETLSKLRIK